MKSSWNRSLLLCAAIVWAVPGLAQADEQMNKVVHGYSEIVYATYSDNLAAAKSLEKAIDAFVAKPSQKGLEQARLAWKAAREFYGQTEAFRFYGGPIDDENGPEGRMNSWPMDESYVDYIQDNNASGLINNPQFKITKTALIEQNQNGGEENVATGWHAIEFLLWGQDHSDIGPGDRSYTDYIDGKTPNADRRRLYLKTLTSLIVDDLAFLRKAWAPSDTHNYRATFNQGGVESIRKMILGLGSLSRGELVGERMEVALFSQDQEDEQSCFSDNTHRDLVNDALGIQNVWVGQYKRADGTVLKVDSLRDLVAAKAPDIAKKTTTQIAKSVQATLAIHAPFDQEILGGPDAAGPKRIQAAIDSVTAQSEDLVESAGALGITRLTITK